MSVIGAYKQGCPTALLWVTHPIIPTVIPFRISLNI